MSKINLTEISAGDIFSEQSHYTFIGKKGDQYQFKHLESGKTLNLDGPYVSNLLKTADVFDKEIEVGKEDKYWTANQIKDTHKYSAPDGVREGDLRQKGIRSIWADIHSQQVFTVNFNKQAQELSKKAFNEAMAKQTEKALQAIETAQKSKKGVLEAAKAAISEIQNNPIVGITKGEERTLRGYKNQFSSINGQYDVTDMDITTGMNKRILNVDQINWLIYDGVKYTVK